MNRRRFRRFLNSLISVVFFSCRIKTSQLIKMCFRLFPCRSRTVTDIPAVQAHQSSAAGKNVGIAFGVLLAVALIAVVAFLVYEPSKR